MRVRILSGNLTGQVRDLPHHEAEAALATGFAEPAPEPEARVASAPPAPGAPPDPEAPAAPAGEAPPATTPPGDTPPEA